MAVTRRKGVVEWWGIKGAKYMVMKDDLTLDGGHTMQCTDHVS